ARPGPPRGAGGRTVPLELGHALRLPAAPRAAEAPSLRPAPAGPAADGGPVRSPPRPTTRTRDRPATDSAEPARPVPSAAAEPEQRIRVPVAEHRLRVQACPQSAEVVEARVEFAQLGGREGVDLPPMGSASVAAEDRFEDAEILVEVLLDEPVDGDVHRLPPRRRRQRHIVGGGASDLDG